MCCHSSVVSDILCGLCSHSISGAAEMRQRLLRGPCGPPAECDLDRDSAFGHASKCFHWWARNMLDAAPRRRSSQTRLEPKLNQARALGERCGFCWQLNVSRSESDSVVAVWAWIIEGLVMTTVAKHLYSLPSPPGRGRTQQMLSSSSYDFWKWLMIIKRWHHLHSWTDWYRLLLLNMFRREHISRFHVNAPSLLVSSLFILLAPVFTSEVR